MLSGAATVDTLRSNLGRSTWRGTRGLDEELAALDEPPEEYWERRAELAWN